MQRRVGLTKTAGYEIGVSRTVAYPTPVVWELLTSPEGTALWLGEGARIDPQPGGGYETADGTVGETRSFRPHDRIRLTWRPPGWTHDSTVQVAVIGDERKTVLRFHQERLVDAAEREQQREHWRSVIAALEAALEAALDARSGQDRASG